MIRCLRWLMAGLGLAILSMACSNPTESSEASGADRSSSTTEPSTTEPSTTEPATTEVSSTQSTDDAPAAIDADQADTDPSSSGEPPPVTLPAPGQRSPAWPARVRLERTLNLGGVLELGRDEDPWGPDLDPEDLAEIAAQGFSAVRIPVRFSDWAQETDPYAIDPLLFARLDETLDAADRNGLAAIIDLHHYEEIFDTPLAERDRLIGIWSQVARYYADRPTETVFYEILNEPNSALTDELWNEILAAAVRAVRSEDPNRTIIVGPTNWNDNLALPGLVLPDDDNLLLTFHYYAPFEFTHQGAVWVDDSDDWLGTRWSPGQDSSGAENAGQLIDDEFTAVAAWARDRDLPVLLGEFGVLDTAAQSERIKWIRWVREAAQNEGFAWAFWDWAGPGFGLHNNASGLWDNDVLNALMPNR